MNDLRYALRSLRKHPTFSSVAILTIALGIGSVTALFSVVDAVLLQDLPYEAPEELVQVWSTNAERGEERGFMSPPTSPTSRRGTAPWSTLQPSPRPSWALIDRDGSAVKVVGSWAGENLFSVLGVDALLGRTLMDGDGAPDAAKAMVLGYEFWQSRFGGDAGVLGQSLMVEEDLYTGWE